MSAKDKAIEVLKSYTSWQGSFSNSQVVRAMLDFADQQTKELREELKSYKSLLDDGVNEVKKLQKENDRLKDALHRMTIEAGYTKT